MYSLYDILVLCCYDVLGDVYCCEEGICKITRTYHGGDSKPGIQNGGIFGVTIYANASIVLAHTE